MVTVVHISDLHVGATGYSVDLAENTVRFINRLYPDVVVITGDLTDDGLVHEYERAVDLLSRIEAGELLVVPGNHDSRNLGYMVFEELFDTRYPFVRREEVCIQGVDSSEPDIDDGHIGRLAYSLVKANLSGCGNALKIVALHHHLVPVPGTGRERNIPVDAGDFLDLLVDAGVNIVLSGHKHVPWMWELNGILLLHAGTATTLRLKAGIPPSFNVIRLDGGNVEVTRVNSKTLKEETIYRGRPSPYRGYTYPLTYAEPAATLRALREKLGASRVRA